VRLHNVLTPMLSCREVSGEAIEQCIACVRDAVGQMQRGLRGAIGAPDYEAYVAHCTARHPDMAPLSERDYVKMYIQRRYNRRDASRCC
jgi:uncharacterized short protein YbdD (DUF466 family)